MIVLIKIITKNGTGQDEISPTPHDVIVTMTTRKSRPVRDLQMGQVHSQHVENVV